MSEFQGFLLDTFGGQAVVIGVGAMFVLMGAVTWGMMKAFGWTRDD